MKANKTFSLDTQVLEAIEKYQKENSLSDVSRAAEELLIDSLKRKKVI